MTARMRRFTPGVLTGGAAAAPLLILSAMQVLNMLQLSAFGVLLPEIRDWFGVSGTLALTLSTLASFVTLCLAVPMKSAGRAVDFHAGEGETSRTMVSRPDLVHLDRANNESGADLARQKLPDSLYTGIWWYARFPNHYAGDGSVASKALGEFDTKTLISDLVTAIKAVKADSEGLKLQKQFYDEATHPLDTR